MKKSKIIPLILILVLCTSLCACAQNGLPIDGVNTTPSPSPSPSITPAPEIFSNPDAFISAANVLQLKRSSLCFEHILELVNAPESPVSLDITLFENGYGYVYGLEGFDDPKESTVSFIVDFYNYDNLNERILFDEEKLGILAENMKLEYFEDRNILFCSYVNEDEEEVGKMFFLPSNGHRVKGYLPNWYYASLIEDVKDPFEIKEVE